MKNLKLKPWYVTGITDSEGTFSCYIKNISIDKIVVSLEFKVAQKTHSSNILYGLKDYFSEGTIVIDNRISDTKKFHITSLSIILNKVIPHFNSYPCLTSKYLNFKDWSDIANMLNQDYHKNLEGIKQIKKIAENMNSKRTFHSKYIHCMKYLNIHLKGVSAASGYLLPNEWVQAFIDGEGTFYNYLSPSLKDLESANKLICDSSLEVAQNSHDVAILLALKTFFEAGYIKPKYDFTDLSQSLDSRSVNRFIIRDTKKIIDFFNKFPLITRKVEDYLDWKKIAQLKDKMRNKNQLLNKEVFEEMWKIKNKTNSKR